MKRSSPIYIAILFLVSCSNLTPQQKNLIASAESIAAVAATAAATVYGGPAAGAAASAGLSAIGSVIQGYVGTNVPTAVVQNSAGIQAVGQAVAAILPDQPVNQKTVDTIHKAAAIATTLKSSNILPVVTPSATPAPSP